MASPSSRRSQASGDRREDSPQSAASTASATSRTPPPRARRPANSAAENASRYVSRAHAASRRAGDHGGGNAVEVRLAPHRGAERLEPLGRREQHRGSVSAPGHGERDL